MGAGTTKGQLVDDRTNVWCTNCHGQGHMKLDCPSPQALSPKCRYYGGDHDISSCSKMINEGQRLNEMDKYTKWKTITVDQTIIIMAIEVKTRIGEILTKMGVPIIIRVIILVTIIHLVILTQILIQEV